MVTGLCPIHVAVLANQLFSLRELLEGGASVETQERSCGRTALHLATESNNVSLAGCLLLEVQTRLGVVDQSEDAAAVVLVVLVRFRLHQVPPLCVCVVRETPVWTPVPLMAPPLFTSLQGGALSS